MLQSAAMEETVIWEQHTVTLHRVSFYVSSVHSPPPARPGHPNPVVCLVFSSLFPSTVPLPIYLSSASVLSGPAVAAGCVVMKQ